MKKTTLIVIILNIIAGAFDIAGGVIHSNFDRLMVGVLFVLIAFMMYIFEKAVKWRDDVIDSQNKYEKKQDEFINHLLEELRTLWVVIDINLIKIPKKFTKPKKEKLDHRFEFYNKNKCFEVPIVINANNELVDGYTSYLIAKKYNIKTVRAKVKIGKENNNE